MLMSKIVLVNIGARATLQLCNGAASHPNWAAAKIDPAHTQIYIVLLTLGPKQNIYTTTYGRQINQNMKLSRTQLVRLKEF